MKKLQPFNLLDDIQLNKVAAVLEEEYYPAQTFIARQGEVPRHVLFLIIEGKVKVFVVDQAGNEIVIAYREPYEYMGEAVFLSGEEYPASAVAVEDTRCFVIPHEIFECIIAEKPDFAGYFTRVLSERLRILYQKFYDEDEGVKKGGFSKRIADIMVSRVITCSPSADVRQIAAIMHDNNVSSVVVADKGRPLGIITERDFVSRILQGPNIQKNIFLTARDFMSLELIMVKPGDFSYEAFLLMVKHRIKHVLVVDDAGRLIGIVAMRDVIKSRETGSFAIVHSIETSKTIEEVSGLSAEVDQVLQALLVEKATVKEITSLITEFYDRITRKIIELAEYEMVKTGYGPVPVSYCWISMGSSGRKEQYARTDQDNGIIYEDVGRNDEKKIKDYFLVLGEKIVSGLEKYGFRRCRGGVMANSEQWCRSLQGWREAINKWLLELQPENVRLMTIFLDFRYVYGDKILYDLLKNFVLQKLQNSSLALNFLVKDNLAKKVPITLFRKIQTERSGAHRNHINLKTSSCVHIVDCIRVFALREGLNVTNTFERIEQIAERNIMKQKDVELLAAAYENLMMLRIRDAMAKMRKGEEPDNYINLKSISYREYSMLRDALIMVNRLQMITENHFRFVM